LIGLRPPDGLVKVRGCQPFNIHNLKLARFNEIFHFLIEMLADRG
jgi:hypothetical protein